LKQSPSAKSKDWAFARGVISDRARPCSFVVALAGGWREIVQTLDLPGAQSNVVALRE
jgi:hypothetical protein